MNIAVSLRYYDTGSNDVWSIRQYITNYFMIMAKKFGVGMCAIMSDNDFESICERCDGLIIPGTSTPINPKYYGGIPEEPVYDEYALDQKLMRYFTDHNKPIFGLCGGHQKLNIFFGGTIRWIKPENSHNDTIHDINITKDSFVYDVFQSEKATINSYHCLEIDRLASELSVVATSPDGVIEAVENKERRIFATQWHPELTLAQENSVEHKFFENFFKCCAEK